MRIKGPAITAACLMAGLLSGKVAGAQQETQVPTQTAPPTTPTAPTSAPAASAAAPKTADPKTQSPKAQDPQTSEPNSPQTSDAQSQPASQIEPADEPAPASPKTYQVPAGTKVLLSLKSAVNTKTARVGDGVYLISAFPVVVGNRVMIPAGVYVQGQVDRVLRPGRGWGRGEVAMHFTSIIFPNGTVVSIPGVVNSLPGSGGPKVKDGEGTIQGEGNAGRVGGDVAKGAEIGAGPGVIGGAVEGRPFTGLGVGAAVGAAGGLIYSLFTRGKDVNIEAGSQIEMLLQRPLLLEDANLTGSDAAPQLVPAAQLEPLKKPNGRPRIMCPLGVACN